LHSINSLTAFGASELVFFNINKIVGNSLSMEKNSKAIKQQMRKSWHLKKVIKIKKCSIRTDVIG
jgi:hypothetical protein